LAKTAPFHTNAQEYPPRQRQVYHDRDECFEGQKIKDKDRKAGTGGKERCGFCIGLD
jgi:hypothetical protein